MISLKIGAIIIGAFAAGAFVMSPVPQAIAAVIATDVQCAGCVGTSDIAGNAMTAAKIKDGEVKAAEIATDAVGGAELQGVSKFLFGKCLLTSTEETSNIPSGDVLSKVCSINGVDPDDIALATMNDGNSCFAATQAYTGANNVIVYLTNGCATTQQVGDGTKIAILVYDK